MFLGGETGKIEVKGGAGDAVYGGGGAGGRIAVYHYHDIDAMAGYRGEFNTEGGTGAEPGASGTLCWANDHNVPCLQSDIFLCKYQERRSTFTLTTRRRDCTSTTKARSASPSGRTCPTSDAASTCPASSGQRAALSSATECA